MPASKKYSSLLASLYKVLFVPALLFVCTEVHGQAPEVRAEGSGAVTFSCVSWDQLSFDELYYRDGQEYLALEVIPYRRSKSYALKGVSGLEIFIKGLDESGVVEYRLIGQAEWHPKTRRMLFFLIESDTDSGPPLQVMGVDDSLKVFPRGAFRFFNMTNTPLRVGFGSSVELMQPKSVRIVKPEIENKGSFVPFLVVDESGEKVYETRLVGQSTGREMVFIMPPTGSMDRVTVKFISQIVPRRNQPQGEQK
jgi:hypothetical protein